MIYVRADQLSLDDRFWLKRNGPEYTAIQFGTVAGQLEVRGVDEQGDVVELLGRDRVLIDDLGARRKGAKRG